MKTTIERIEEASSKKPETSSVRDPFYQVSDGIAGLGGAVFHHKILREDRKYKTLLKALERAHKDLRDHLNSKYTWD
jgi:hypothetical protein